jgi:Ca2+-binding RTX toxin-like protein
MRYATWLVMAIAIGLAFVSARADAQCSTSCNQATDHWVLPGTGSNADNVAIGMIRSGNSYYPAACVWSGTHWAIVGFDSAHRYSFAQLDADTSVCLGGGNDRVQLVQSWITCYDVIFGDPYFVEWFHPNGYELRVSLEGGHDWADLKLRGAGHAIACGHTGNDTLYGSVNVNEYLSGGGDNDFIEGRNDNIRGNAGRDVLRGIDGGKMRGETGSDCFYIPSGATYASGSSCGAESDDYKQSTGASYPGDCDISTANCCNLSSATCPCQLTSGGCGPD